ncbi:MULTISPECIES: heterocyst-inhibiting protein PatX [unclassified Anabaena]|uniref:heterocyst-inhibiting protein PatX n=1 Tax=unclassified Anabaena TaxID=2619674 RepID=UPI0039C66CA8
MRATTSLLVSSLVFSTLAFNCQAKVNRASEILLSPSGSQQYQAQFSEPERPVPHRGSGRRDFMEKSSANAFNS